VWVNAVIVVVTVVACSAVVNACEVCCVSEQDFAQGVISSINKLLARFGILVMSVKITDVKLPDVLQKRLESTTAFKTRIEQQEKEQENRVRVLCDDATQQLEAISKNNARRVQELRAEMQRFEIEAEEVGGCMNVLVV